MNPHYHIRRATPGDTKALYEICLLTGDAGEDASTHYSDPMLPGHVWAGPYAALEPDFVFILSQDDRPVGYVVGTPDTATFENRLEREWWPRVRELLAAFRPAAALDQATLDRINTPERHDPSQLVDYPAHLHINLLPEAQSAGWGRRMIETQLEAMRQAGVRGLQLGVHPRNTRAKGFYEHLGFTDISLPGRVTMGMKLD